MANFFKIMTVSMFLTGGLSATAQSDGFEYSDERFADLQMLRYKVDGFESLTLKQKTFIYYLTEAALHGRDILFDQNGKYNLRIRKMLEAVYTDFKGDRNSDEFKAFEVYLKRVWFSNGIHHHYGCEKFDPEFSESFFRKAVASVDKSLLPLAEGQTVENLCDEICPVIFNPDVMQKRVNQADGEDLILTSACNYYEGVTQKEAEDFYNKMRVPNDHEPIMYGMNSRLVKTADGNIVEKKWVADGLYGQAIKKIVYYLEKAEPFAENEKQKAVIRKLVDFYETGDLKVFDEYSILWVEDTDSRVDFVNGFIESYGDPLGLKSSWESIVNFKDLEATKRTETLSANAQWFEDHSPVDDAFKKEALTNNAVLPVLFLNTLFCSFIFLPLIIISSQTGWLNGTMFHVPVAGWEVHKYIVLKSFIVLGSWVFGYYGMKYLPLTIVGPINATRPVMVLVGAFLFFGERLNLWQWIGVLLAVASFVMLSRSGKKEGIDFKHNKWIVFVLTSNILGALSGLYDKFLMASPAAGGVGLDKMAVQSWYNIYQFFMMGIMMLILWMPTRKKTTPFHWDWCIIMISIFLSAADFVYFYALSLDGAMISIVSMIRRGSVLVSFTFGALIFREKNLKSKVVDLILVLISMIFLFIGTKQ